MGDRIHVPAVVEVAPRLGMTVSGRRWGPCPACGATRDPAARRGPIWCSGPRWACGGCGNRGDTLGLIGWALEKEGRPRGAAFVRVLEWLGLADRDAQRDPQRIKPAPEPIPTRAPEAALRALFRASTPASRSTDAEVLAFLERKGLTTSVPAWVLPPSQHAVYQRTTPWWPAKRSHRWRLAVPAFNGHGLLAGLHARAVVDAQPKALWPSDVDCAGLVFADALGLALLRGEATPDRVLLAEGLSDYLYAASRQLPGLAVLGIEAGSASALRLIRWPVGVELYTSAHLDGAGDRYAGSIASAVAPHAVRSVPLHRVAA